jgi:nitrite reductase/ring-hydroxylating ferredoxin subunit
LADAERLICRTSDLIDGGIAKRFAVEFDGRTLSAFVISFDGSVFGYVNSCPHRGTELDWQPGEVFDESGIYLVCATHGAIFEADSGLCVGGPCQGAALTKIVVEATAEGVFLRTGRLLPVRPSPAPSDAPPL